MVLATVEKHFSVGSKSSVSQFNLDVVQLQKELREEILALAVQAHRCPDCADHPFLVSQDYDLVCRQCGLVVAKDYLEDDKVPVEEGNVEDGHAEGGTSPETHLDFGGGLGSQLDRLASSNILRGRKDKTVETFMNSRARMARVPVCHPLIKDLLSFGSDFCKKHELHQRRNTTHLNFADQLGINLRAIGEFYVKGLGKWWADPYRIAASLFTSLFKEAYPEKYNLIRSGNNGEKDRFPELFLPDHVVAHYGTILKFCHPPILPRLEDASGS